MRTTIRWRVASSVAAVATVVFAFGLLRFATACGCAAACTEADTPILDTSGFVIVAAKSSCANIRSPLPASSVAAFAVVAKTTCHFDVTLDDGEVVSFDVPFTKDSQSCCCGSCTQVEIPDWSPLMLTAPPGYVPNIDAGADASEE